MQYSTFSSREFSSWMLLLLCMTALGCSKCAKSSFAPDSRSVEKASANPKVVEYLISQPTNNRGNGLLTLTTTVGKVDPIEMNIQQLALAAIILESGNAYFDYDTEYLFLASDVTGTEDTVTLKPY